MIWFEHTRARAGSDVARGMAHLVQHKIVHRDLAARNVLVNAEGNCMVADFGLARTTGQGSDTQGGEYYRTENGTFPVSAHAP